MRTTSTLLIIVLACAISLGFLAAQTDWANPESTMAEVRRMDAATEQLMEESRLEREERQRNIEADEAAAKAALQIREADAELQRKIALEDAQHQREMRELLTLFGIALTGAVIIILTVGVTYAIMQRGRQMNATATLSTPNSMASNTPNGTRQKPVRQNGRLKNERLHENRADGERQTRTDWKRQPPEPLVPEGIHL